MNSFVQPVGRHAPVVEKPLQTRAPFCISLWLLISASVSCGGWILSAFHQLNARGYAVWLVLTIAAILWWMKGRRFPGFNAPRPSKWIRRFKRPLPLGFLLLAVLAVLSGVLYPPTNYDALAYRIPRVLHWLAAGQWHWIHTDFPRLNVRASGSEWLIAPAIVFTGSLRPLFIPSIISYLLLPGLLYSMFTRFGISRKVAWHWMWITATAYGFVTQAGSIANDLLGAVYALAAFDFALRLRESSCAEDLWLFAIATALMTGAKASNLPLLLPLFLIFLPSWNVLLAKPPKTVLVVVFAALASFLPTAILNYKNCHDWTGLSLEAVMIGPGKQLAANTGIWIIQNLFPPIFPLASWWDHAVAEKLAAAFKVFPGSFNASEMQVEEGAGLGMGICLLLVVSCMASYFIGRREGGHRHKATLWWKLVLWSSYVSLLVFGLKAEVVASVARLIVPYYPILMVPWLLKFRSELFGRWWWKGLTVLVYALAILLVVMLPGRPLWPAQTVLARLKQSHPSSRLLARAETVYSVYAARANGFAPLVAQLPPDAAIPGFVTFDDPETSLWWPLGSRRIEHVTAADTRQTLESRGIKYIVVSSRSSALHGTVEALLQKYDAEIIKTVPLFLRAGQGMTDWYIIQLRPR